MDRKSQIEEMSAIIDENITFDEIGGGTCSCDSDAIAEALYIAGYRYIGSERKNTKQLTEKIRQKTAEKFAKRLKEEIQGTIPNSGYSGEEIEMHLEWIIDDLLDAEFRKTGK